MVRGALKYNPKEVIEELDKIKRQFGIAKDADAYRKLVDFSEMGRELKIILGNEKRRR